MTAYRRGGAGGGSPAAGRTFLPGHRLIGTRSQQGSGKKQTLIVWRIKTLRIAERRIDM